MDHFPLNPPKVSNSPTLRCPFSLIGQTGRESVQSGESLTFSPNDSCFILINNSAGLHAWWPSFWLVGTILRGAGVAPLISCSIT